MNPEPKTDHTYDDKYIYFNNLQFYGFYGYEDNKTGNLNGLGFIVRDNTCMKDSFTTWD